MKYFVLSIFLLGLFGCSKQDDVNTAAIEKAKVCASCHGLNVEPGIVEAPTLAGRPYEELVTEIQKVNEYFFSQPSLMHDFNEDDIDGIATYFANLK